jgi:hypothetical protein
MGAGTGLRVIDAPSLAIGHHARLQPHRVCAVEAARGTTLLGGCYGCKR